MTSSAGDKKNSEQISQTEKLLDVGSKSGTYELVVGVLSLLPSMVERRAHDDITRQSIKKNK